MRTARPFLGVPDNRLTAHPRKSSGKTIVHALRTRLTANGKVTALVVVALLAGGLGVLAYATSVLRRSELQTIDARFSIRGSKPAPKNLVLVLVDDRTFAELTSLKLKSEWPFPRKYQAEVIEKIRRAGARTIAMDIEYAHPTDEGPNDEALYEAISRAHGKTVLAATVIGPHGSTEILGGARQRQEAGTRDASAILTLDSDGVVRRFSFAHNGLHSFPVVAAEVSSGRAIKASSFEGGTLPIDYAGGPETFRSVSFSQVLQGKVPPSFFSGKTVIVGASAPVLQDVHNTATSGSSVMAGPEILANATETLLEGTPLRFAPGWLDVGLILLLGIVVPLSSVRVQRWRTLLDALLVAVVFAVGAQVAFNRGTIVTIVYPVLALALGTLGTLGVLYVSEAMERQRVRDMFARFVPGDVVDQVLATADENLRLAGVERDCTVLFSDLRGFTSFSETQPAPLVIEVVNHYLNEMTEAILDKGGTLIAYMGDGIMATFGAPLEQADHADRAVAAAEEMIGTRLTAFNDWMIEQGFDHRFAMGVGLNSGPVMAGNVGSERRVEYTTLGDTTNTASRLEGMTKGSGAMIFIADSTRERMQHDPQRLVWVGDLEVRGRSRTIRVWTLPDALKDDGPGSLVRPGERRSPPEQAHAAPVGDGAPGTGEAGGGRAAQQSEAAGADGAPVVG